ncbi:hypothetical protein C8J55DRAFT_487142 [Lentinula edodes]|uniref:Uncharacterized protein n=1 Tax=Lentinula lateritia TaxID=40482 RepID=A0A9W9AUL1_9AGAR|nr:hypothetical protein C8J55DRAFT_487142 [Lentinula edodes]
MPGEPRNKASPRRETSDPHTFPIHIYHLPDSPYPRPPRSKYNEFGIRESAPESVFVNPEEIFSKIFSGERSVGVIGHISLRAAAHTKQVTQLSANLKRKLGIFTESAIGIDDVDVRRSWRIICVLCFEFFGSELLQAIAFDYLSKANPFLATN